MTVLKCITGTTDPFMKEHGFKRKGFVYYRLNGDVIQGVSVIKRNFAISIEVCCIPKYNDLGEYLFKPVDAWIHNNCICSIYRVEDFDTFVEGVTDQYIINVTNRIFNYFTENVFSIIDKVDTIAACNDLYSRVKSGEISAIIDSDLRFQIYNREHELYKLYEDYFAGKKWEEIKDNYDEWINSLLIDSEEFYKERALKLSGLPKDIRDAFVPEIMKDLPFLYMVKLFFDITESESLEPIKEYIDRLYNENKTLFKKYLNFDI